MRWILAVFSFILLLQSCNTAESKYIFNEGSIFGTIYHISYENPKGEDLGEEIALELQRLDMSLSTYKTESVLSKVNTNREVRLDHLFLNVFNKAQEISSITDGAFDATVAPFVNVWGFGFRHKEKISQELIDSIKTFVGYNKLKLVNNVIVKDDDRIMLDFSAIAKGYAVDVIGDLLRENDCKNFMVEIGGEVVAKGVNKEGSIWKIGINEPNDNEPIAPQMLQAIILLKNKAVATSGNYRNFYIENGKKYAHTINPKTGYPVNHNLLSATVIANDCMTADAFATSFMVMGVKKAQELIPTLNNIDVFLIYANGEGENKVVMTDNFQNYIQQ